MAAMCTTHDANKGNIGTIDSASRSRHAKDDLRPESRLTWLENQLAPHLNIPAITVRLDAVLRLEQRTDDQRRSLTERRKVAKLGRVGLGRRDGHCRGIMRGEYREAGSEGGPSTILGS